MGIYSRTSGQRVPFFDVELGVFYNLQSVIMIVSCCVYLFAMYLGVIAHFEISTAVDQELRMLVMPEQMVRRVGAHLQPPRADLDAQTEASMPRFFDGQSHKIGENAPIAVKCVGSSKQGSSQKPV